MRKRLESSEIWARIRSHFPEKNQRDIAEMLKIEPQRITKWKNNKLGFGVDVLQRAAQITGKSIEWLTSGGDRHLVVNSFYSDADPDLLMEIGTNGLHEEELAEMSKAVINFFSRDSKRPISDTETIEIEVTGNNRIIAFSSLIGFAHKFLSDAGVPNSGSIINTGESYDHFERTNYAPPTSKDSIQEKLNLAEKLIASNEYLIEMQKHRIVELENEIKTLTDKIAGFTRGASAG